LRRTGLEGPILAVIGAILLSVLVNVSKIENQGLMTNVLKSLTFFLSFFVLIYILRSTIRRASTLDFIIKTLVISAAILAVFAVVESRTRANAFNNLHAYLPFLHPLHVLGLSSLSRGARLRAYATAEHPIALGAAFALIVPLAGYLVMTKSRRWIVPLLLILAGALAPVSRTALVMLFVIAIIFLRAQPTAMRRFWPALIPMIVAVHFALPGTLGTLKQSFSPQGGIVKEQQANNQGRLADWGPALREWSNDPLSGRGFGTVIIVTGGVITPVTQQLQNDRILDDQWLGTLRETGLFGVTAFAWLFFGASRRLRKAAELDESPRGTLLQCLRASIIAFAIGMWTYDAFSFVQVTLLMFIILGFASVALAPEYAAVRERVRVPFRPRPKSAPAPA
jgi:hypothetical protein